MGGRGSEFGTSGALSNGTHKINIGAGELTYVVYPNENTISVKGIVVDKDSRNQGIGSKLLDKMISISDHSGRPLELFAVPIRNSTMSWDTLIDWYKKRGFKYEFDGYMKYEPKRRR